MDRPEHFVRADDAPPPPPVKWWKRLYGHLHHFMFEKEPGYVPLYHGNYQGATINDPRYTPGLFNRERVDLSNPEADRNLTNESD
jgi:hypothetical protein